MSETIIGVSPPSLHFVGQARRRCTLSGKILISNFKFQTFS